MPKYFISPSTVSIKQLHDGQKYYVAHFNKFVRKMGDNLYEEDENGEITKLCPLKFTYQDLSLMKFQLVFDVTDYEGIVSLITHAMEYMGMDNWEIGVMSTQTILEGSYIDSTQPDVSLTISKDLVSDTTFLHAVSPAILSKSNMRTQVKRPSITVDKDNFEEGCK